MRREGPDHRVQVERSHEYLYKEVGQPQRRLEQGGGAGVHADVVPEIAGIQGRAEGVNWRQLHHLLPMYVWYHTEGKVSANYGGKSSKLDRSRTTASANNTTTNKRIARNPTSSCLEIFNHDFN